MRTYAILRVLVGLAICISGLFVEAKEADTRLWLIIVAAGWVPVGEVVSGAPSQLRRRPRLPRLGRAAESTSEPVSRD